MIESGTEQWFQARLGRVTASRIADLTARTKSGWGSSRANYAAELIAERLTGVPAESYKSPAMQWGCDYEAEAIAHYVLFRNAIVTPAGYIDHPTIAMAGATPDGFAAPDGLIEVKCPNTATHIVTLQSRKIPDKYFAQMQWQMACTGRNWCDFISFDPRMPLKMRLFDKRLARDDQAIAVLIRLVADFLAELDDTLARLGALYDIPGVEPRPSLTEQLQASVRA